MKNSKHIETTQTPEVINPPAAEAEPVGKARFNLRKLNLPPVKRDHSRSVDYSRAFREIRESKAESKKDKAPCKPAHTSKHAQAAPLSIRIVTSAKANAGNACRERQLSIDEGRHMKTHNLNLREKTSKHPNNFWLDEAYF